MDVIDKLSWLRLFHHAGDIPYAKVTADDKRAYRLRLGHYANTVEASFRADILPEEAARQACLSHGFDLAAPRE